MLVQVLSPVLLTVLSKRGQAQSDAGPLFPSAARCKSPVMSQRGLAHYWRLTSTPSCRQANLESASWHLYRGALTSVTHKTIVAEYTRGVGRGV
jgi:hypothetical protein